MQFAFDSPPASNRSPDVLETSVRPTKMIQTIGPVVGFTRKLRQLIHQTRYGGRGAGGMRLILRPKVVVRSHQPNRYPTTFTCHADCSSRMVTRCGSGNSMLFAPEVRDTNRWNAVRISPRDSPPRAAAQSDSLRRLCHGQIPHRKQVLKMVFDCAFRYH